MALSLARATQRDARRAACGRSVQPALKEYLALGARSSKCSKSLQRLNCKPTHRRRSPRVCGLRPRFDRHACRRRVDSGMLPYRVADALEMPLVGVGRRHRRCATRARKSGNSCRRVCAVVCEASAARAVAVHPMANAAPTLRVRALARRHDRTGRHAGRRQPRRPRMDDRARERETGASRRRRKALGPRAHALGDDDRKPWRQRRN